MVVMASKLEQTDFSKAEIQPVLPMSHPCDESPVKINYDYMGKVSAWIAEVKFQPGLGKPRPRLTVLKISHVIVFSPDLNNNFHSFSSLFSPRPEIFQVIANNFYQGYVG